MFIVVFFFFFFFFLRSTDLAHPNRTPSLSSRKCSKPSLQYFEHYRYDRLHPALDCSPSADWRLSENTWGRLHQMKDRCSYGGGNQGFRYCSSCTSSRAPIPCRESLAASMGKPVRPGPEG